jgi:hypothetical protein
LVCNDAPRMCFFFSIFFLFSPGSLMSTCTFVRQVRRKSPLAGSHLQPLALLTQPSSYHRSCFSHWASFALQTHGVMFHQLVLETLFHGHSTSVHSYGRCHIRD